MDKQERKSKDDLYKDEYKMENKEYKKYDIDLNKSIQNSVTKVLQK